MTTQITIVSPNQADKAVAVTVQQFHVGSDAWVNVKSTVILQPGASMSEYIHRTQRVVIGELELVAPVDSAVDAADQAATESKVQNSESSAPADDAAAA